MSAPTSRTARRVASFLQMPWRWSVVSTPILAALTLYTLGAGLDVLNVSVLYVAPVALFAVFGTVAAVRRTDLGSFPRTYAITVVALAGLWLVWTSVTTAWSKQAVTVLACGLALFGPLWFLARHSEHRKRMREEDERRRQLAAAEARR